MEVPARGPTCRRSTGPRSTPCAASRAPSPPRPTSRTATRRRLPVLHVRRPGRRRPARRVLPRAVGRRPAGGPRQRRRAQPPPRRRAQPRPVHARGARARAFDVLVGDQGRRSTRTASSTRASSGCRRRGARRPAGEGPGRRRGPPRAAACAADAADSHVVSATARAGPDPRRRRRHLRGPRRGRAARRHGGRRPPPAGAARLAGARPRRVRPRAMADAALDVARGGPGRRRPGRRGGHHQPAGLDGRLGPRHRRARRPRARLAGPAHGRRLPRAAGRGPAPRPQPVGHQGRPPARRRRPRPHPRPVRRHRRHLDRLAPDRAARCTSPTCPTPRSPACVVADGTDWDDKVLDALRIPRAALPDDRRLDRRRRRGHALDGAPPIAGIAGDQQASLVGQGCVRPGLAKITFGTGGMLDVCLGPERPAFAPRRAAGARSRSSPGGAAARRRGVSRRSCCRPAPTSSGCATTSASSTSAEESHEVAAAVRDDRRRGVRARAARPGHAHGGTTAPGARCSASPGAPDGPRSCGPCSRASPSGAPTWSRPPRPTPGCAIDRLRVDGGMSGNPTFVQALADATERPVEVSPEREATTLGAAFLAGLAVGHVGRLGRPRRHVAPDAVVEPRPRRSTATAGGSRRPGRRLGARPQRHQLLSRRAIAEAEAIRSPVVRRRPGRTDRQGRADGTFDDGRSASFAGSGSCSPWRAFAGWWFVIREDAPEEAEHRHRRPRRSTRPAGARRRRRRRRRLDGRHVGRGRSTTSPARGPATGSTRSWPDRHQHRRRPHPRRHAAR